MRPEVQVLPGPLVRSDPTTYPTRPGGTVKKLLALLAALGAVAALKRKKGQQSTDVWRQATK
jgi:predicted secreted protein